MKTQHRQDTRSNPQLNTRGILSKTQDENSIRHGKRKHVTFWDEPNTPIRNQNKLKPQMIRTHTPEWAKRPTLAVNMNSNNQIKSTPQTHRGKIKNTTNIISKLKVLTINVRGAKSKQASLTSVLHTHGTHVAAITETHLDKNETLSINGYHWCGKTGTAKAGE